MPLLRLCVVALLLSAGQPVLSAQQRAVELPTSLSDPARRGTFAEAIRLRSDGRLSESADILVALVRESPRQQRYLETALEVLLQDKQLDRGLELVRSSPIRDTPTVQLLEGDLLHRTGQREEAFRLWRTLSEREGASNRWQWADQVGQRLHSYGDYGQEIEHYRRIRQLRSDSRLYTWELALAHLQQGEVETAMDTYLEGLRHDASLLSTIQSQLAQIMDDEWLERAIARLEGVLGHIPAGGNTPPDGPDKATGATGATAARNGVDEGQQQMIVQLLSWIHLQNGSFEAGFTLARTFEEARNYLSYSLYSYGIQLVTYKQHSLAIRAFTVYADNAELDPGRRRDAMFRIVDTYLDWVDGTRNDAGSLPLSVEMLEDSVFVWLGRLDHLDPSPAEQAGILGTTLRLRLERGEPVQVGLDSLLASYRAMARSAGSGWVPVADARFIDGLLALHDGAYLDARIAFTDVIRELSGPASTPPAGASGRVRAGSGSGQTGATLTLHPTALLERARYHLGLTELFSGEAEFASIQFTTMQKEISSYLANDAMRVTSVLQQVPPGADPDSTLRPFFSALQAITLDRKTFIAEVSQWNASGGRWNPQAASWGDDLLLFWASRVRGDELPWLLSALEQRTLAPSLLSTRHSERLLWLHILALEAAQAHSGAEPISSGSSLDALLTTYLERHPRGYYRIQVSDRLRMLRQSTL